MPSWVGEDGFVPQTFECPKEEWKRVCTQINKDPKCDSIYEAIRPGITLWRSQVCDDRRLPNHFFFLLAQSQRKPVLSVVYVSCKSRAGCRPSLKCGCPIENPTIIPSYLYTYLERYPKHHYTIMYQLTISHLYFHIMMCHRYDYIDLIRSIYWGYILYIGYILYVIWALYIHKWVFLPLPGNYKACIESTLNDENGSLDCLVHARWFEGDGVSEPSSSLRFPSVHFRLAQLRGDGVTLELQSESRWKPVHAKPNPEFPYFDTYDVNVCHLTLFLNHTSTWLCEF